MKTKRRAIFWKENGKYESIPLDFSKATGQTLLVIPRSEVLQKEVALTPADSREDLETRIAQLLPYSPKDMAYSLAVDSSDKAGSSKGLLYAIPGEKVKAILGFLERSGILVDEVVSEDQALFWLLQNKAEAGPILVFDQTSDRTLFLALRTDAILLSRTYPRDEALKNVLSEASFSILESGIKPVKVFISGSIDSEEVARTFEIHVESFEAEDLEGAPIPPVFSGAKKWGQYPPISLLPSERKIQKRAREQNRLLKESLLAFGLFVFCVSLLSASHLFILKSKKNMLENESKKITSSVAEVRRMSASLEAVHEAERSKERLLSLMREFARRVPSSIRLKELQIEGRSIVFQGESPSHALLTETVQVFEKTEGVKEAKLEHARLRKRLNQDFFDFEVSARWQN